MRMLRFDPALVLLLFGFARVICAADLGEETVSELCTGVLNLVDHACDFTFNIPKITAGVTEQCCCFYDCNQCYYWCCSSWTNCGVNCRLPADLCLPCFACNNKRCNDVGQCVHLPTVTIETTSTSICDELEKQGFDVDAAVTLVQTLCPCMLKAVEFYIDNAEALVDSVSLETATETTVFLLEGYGEQLECFSDASTDSEKETIIAETEAAGGIVLWGEEIGISEYSQLVSATVFCALGEGCLTLYGIFRNYFRDTATLIVPELSTVLREYYLDRIFGPVKTLVGSFESSVGVGRSALLSFEMQAGDCLDALSAELKNDLKVLIQAYDSTKVTVEEKATRVKEVATSIEQIGDNVEGAIEAVENAADFLTGSFVEQIEQLVSAKKRARITAAVEFLANHENVKNVVSGAKVVVTFLLDIEDCFAEFATSIRELEGAANQVATFASCQIDAPANAVATLDTAVSLAIQGVEDVLQEPLGASILVDSLRLYV